MANVDIRLGHKNTAWFTTNSTLVLKDGQMVVCSDGANQGKYKIGDGTTQLSALTFYGGVSVSPAWGSITGTLSNQTDLQTALNGKQNTITTGTTSQYLRGDLSLATFPTNVSSFTNDSGYITSSALSPYLTSVNAALTYQPIGSYLTGLTVGSTAIGSGTSARILYNNSGVLGEYLVTGTGTTVVLSTSPTISTSLTVTTASTTNVIRDLVGTPTSSAIYLNQTTPSPTNYTITSDGSNVYLNTQSTTGFCYITTGNNTRFYFGRSGMASNFAADVSGATTTFSFIIPAHTGQNASTEISNFKVYGASKTWDAGAITNQRWNYFTANTAAFASASTITNSYGLFVEAATAGTNATITNNYAIGTNGDVCLIGGNRILRSSGGNLRLDCASGSVVRLDVSGSASLTASSTQITLRDPIDFVLGTTTGTKFGTAPSQKLSFWNATPIVQPTTAVVAATFVSNTSAIANDTATFDGYTIGQIVKALRNIGILA